MYPLDFLYQEKQDFELEKFSFLFIFSWGPTLQGSKMNIPVFSDIKVSMVQRSKLGRSTSGISEVRKLNPRIFENAFL
jgi:hypothetical protein